MVWDEGTGERQHRLLHIYTYLSCLYLSQVRLIPLLYLNHASVLHEKSIIEITRDVDRGHGVVFISSARADSYTPMSPPRVPPTQGSVHVVHSVLRTGTVCGALFPQQTSCSSGHEQNHPRLAIKQAQTTAATMIALAKGMVTSAYSQS